MRVKEEKGVCAERLFIHKRIPVRNHIVRNSVVIYNSYRIGEGIFTNKMLESLITLLLFETIPMA